MLVQDYLDAGFVLVPIPKGSKGPEGLAAKGWNKRERCVVPADWTGNIGLAHAYSGTCAIDIDDLEAAAAWLAARGVMLGALLDEPEAVRISSGRANRAKLIYRLTVPLNSKKIIEDKRNIIDFRCASSTGTTVQDVLPPSIHPDTGKPYTWEYADELIGDWRALPLIPQALLDIWTGLLTQQSAPSVGKESTVDITELRTLLADHDPDCDRDAWVETLAIIHYETAGSEEGLKLADEWSAKGEKYKGLKDVRTRWRSFHLDHANPKTANSLRVDKPASPDDFEVVTTTQAAIPRPAFKRDKSGRILATLNNVLMALRSANECGVKLRRDTFRDEIMLARADEWRPLGDVDYVLLREALTGRGFYEIGRELIRDAVLKVASENEFDSAQAWLALQQWDGVERIRRLMPDYFGSEDTPYAHEIGRYLMTAFAGRVIAPGCVADMAPVLVGPQGCGKTRGVMALAPTPEQYVSIDLTERDADLARTMRGRLVGEIDELRGLQSREMESIKAFISRKFETWVPKYQEMSVTFPRRVVFIGTTNQEEFLADETGNRRWLPIHVGVVNVDRIRADCAQLWAEAAVVYLADGVAYQGAENLGVERHSDFVVSDAWEESVAHWLNNKEGGRSPRKLSGVTLRDVAVGALNFDERQMTHGTQLRIGKILRKLGLNKRVVRRYGSNCKVWQGVGV